MRHVELAPEIKPYTHYQVSYIQIFIVEHIWIFSSRSFCMVCKLLFSGMQTEFQSHGHDKISLTKFFKT